MILVTGGTGFVGQEVVAALLSLGYRVRVLARRPDRATRFPHHAHVEFVRGDALQPETLSTAMKDVHAVIHLIGIIAETAHVTFERAHVEATRNVLAAARQAGVTRWIQMSAEGTRPQASSKYHATKWEAEELVRQSGLDWTIFRPSLIYGYDERDQVLTVLRLALISPVFPVLSGGRALIQPVSVRDVAHCFAHAVASEASIARTYDVVGPVAFSWREMISKVAGALGKTTRYQAIPVLILLRALLWLTIAAMPVLVLAALKENRLDLPYAEIAAGLWVGLWVAALQWRTVLIFSIPLAPLQLVSRMLKACAPRYLQFQEQLKMATEDNVGDPKPAMQTFHYTPQSFEQGLLRLFGNS